MRIVLIVVAVVILGYTGNTGDIPAWISVGCAQLFSPESKSLIPFVVSLLPLIYFLAASDNEWVGIATALVAGACFPSRNEPY